MSSRPILSIVMATKDRRDVLLDTLDQVEKCGLAPSDFEMIVVDNASTDGTTDAIVQRPNVRAEILDCNLGSCAKAVGVDRAKGEFVLFLDDDSYPRRGAVERMLARFEADPKLAAAGFTVHLPDGSQECSALPHVFVGCGVGLRAAALREVGNLDRSFFMQAEEYDLAFRLLQGGWNVDVFSDLQVDHLKSPTARRSDRTTFYDVRNNLRVIARYLPAPFAAIYRDDWLQRYRWFAEQAGHQAAYARGVNAGRWRAREDRCTHQEWQLDPHVLESVFRWGFVEQRMRSLYERGHRRIALADLGKNTYAFHRGAIRAGLDIVGIADDQLAAPGRTYRDTPLVTTSEALAGNSDAFVVSNTSYVHAHRRWETLGGRTSRPVHSWFDPPRSVPLSAPTDAVTT